MPFPGQWLGEWSGDWLGARQPAAAGALSATLSGGGAVSADLQPASAEVIAIGAGPRKKPWQFPQWEPAPERLPSTAAARRREEDAALLLRVI